MKSISKSDDAYKTISEVTKELGLIDKNEAFMLLSQILEASVTQFVNPTYTYLLKVNKKYLV